MARSLAFWMENPQPADDKNSKVELHFNYWSLFNGTTNYLDIGVKFSDTKNFDFIKFYLPFETNQITYKYDLGKKICKNTELVAAIFNAHPTKIVPDQSKEIHDFYFTEEQVDKPLKFFTQISETSGTGNLEGASLTPFNQNGENGCILTFPKKGLFDNISLDAENYFRFRIILTPSAAQTISQIYKANDSAITSHFEKTEMIDFRVNESRNLPEHIRGLVEKNSYLYRVHFFLIREANSEYKMSHSQYSRCRILENDLWNNYLEDGDTSEKEPNQMLIYHWKSNKEENGIDHFSAFAKFSRRNVTGWDISAIVILIIILSAGSGILANLVWSFFEGEVQSCSSEENTREAKTSSVTPNRLSNGKKNGEEPAEPGKAEEYTMENKANHGGGQ